MIRALVWEMKHLASNARSAVPCLMFAKEKQFHLFMPMERNIITHFCKVFIWYFSLKNFSVLFILCSDLA